MILCVLLRVANCRYLASCQVPCLNVRVLANAGLFRIIILIKGSIINNASFRRVSSMLLARIFLRNDRDLRGRGRNVLDLGLRKEVRAIITVIAIFRVVFFSRVVRRRLTTTSE